MIRKLLVAIAAVSFLSFTYAAPIDAGVATNNWPTGEDVRYDQDGISHQPANQWLPIFNGMYNGGSQTCRQDIRFGTFYDRAYAQIRYVAGDCDWGGVQLTWYRPADNNWFVTPTGKGMCTTGNLATSNSCVQLSDGSLWIQPTSNVSTVPISVSGVICQTTVTIKTLYKCHRGNNEINF